MKKIFIFLFISICFLVIPFKVSAVTYTETTPKVMKYNISNFYLSGNYIVLNGWATTERHQHFTSSSTHEYSLVLTDATTSKKLTYVATLKNADKTEFMKQADYTSVCSTLNSTAKCYYKYTYAGFEFKIPLSDLESDREYGIKLRVYEKKTGKGYQQSIYALSLNNSYDKNGVRYQLYSDITKTRMKVIESQLIVRSGAGQSYSHKKGTVECSGNGTYLFWKQDATYNNIRGVKQVNEGTIGSELWINLKYKYGACVNGKARVVDGTTYHGWGPFAYMTASGTPATIRTTALDNITINELKTYTAPKNTKTKVLATITSGANQTVTIKGYHDDVLVYNKSVALSGTKTIQIDYEIENSGTFRIDIVGNAKTISGNSKIYVSSEETIVADSLTDDLVTIDTPILVVTDKNLNVTEYKEKIKFSVTPTNSNIVQGGGFEIDSYIAYYYPLDEFYLNDDYVVYAMYPSKDESLAYELINEKVKVDLEKDEVLRKDDYDLSYFKNPKIQISKLTGFTYNDKETTNNYLSGGNKWYPSWNDKKGTYSYQYIGTNIGINKITITKNLTYTITSNIFNSNEGFFKIKRTNNPDNSTLIYKNKFTYKELIDYLGALE